MEQLRKFLEARMGWRFRVGGEVLGVYSWSTIDRRRRLPRLEPEWRRHCPPGNFFFVVTAGRLSEQMVGLVESEVEVGRVEGLGCGREFADSYYSLTFRLAHTLEHLTVLDLVGRGVISLTKIKLGRAVAVTVQLDDATASFWIRRGLCSIDEQWRSLSQAAGRVDRVISRGVTGPAAERVEGSS